MLLKIYGLNLQTAKRVLKLVCSLCADATLGKNGFVDKEKNRKEKSALPKPSKPEPVPEYGCNVIELKSKVRFPNIR